MIDPLELLFEAEGLPRAELPELLRALYGGDLGFEEPRLYANFVSTVDGVVAIPSLPRSNALVGRDSAADRFVMGLLRAFADAVLVGAGTLRESPQGTWLPERVYPPAAPAFAELRRARGRPDGPEIAIVTGHGSIDPAHPVLASGAVVLTSEVGAARLEGRVPEAASVVVLGPEPGIDPRRAVEALRERGHQLVLSEAGPHTFGKLVAFGLADELFLTVSPLLAGNRGHMSRLGLAEGVELMPPGVEAGLLGVRRHEAHVFLRYELGGRRAER